MKITYKLILLDRNVLKCSNELWIARHTCKSLTLWNLWLQKLSNRKQCLKPKFRSMLLLLFSGICKLVLCLQGFSVFLQKDSLTVALLWTVHLAYFPHFFLLSCCKYHSVYEVSWRCNSTTPTCNVLLWGFQKPLCIFASPFLLHTI